MRFLKGSVEGQRDTYTLPYLQQAGRIVHVPEEENDSAAPGMTTPAVVRPTSSTAGATSTDSTSSRNKRKRGEAKGEDRNSAYLEKLVDNSTAMLECMKQLVNVYAESQRNKRPRKKLNLVNEDDDSDESETYE